MRRSKQLIPDEAVTEILEKGRHGVLGVSGDDNYPYTVPLSYVYHDGKIYFHCAKSGHKLDAIQRNDKVSFCVIDQDEIIPKEFTTYFRSVIVFGRARILVDDGDKHHAMQQLVRKYSPGFEREGADEIKQAWNALCVVEITPEHITGKEAVELTRMR